MASTDYPFSVSAKVIGADGSEHLVTVRGATIDQGRDRLAEGAPVYRCCGMLGQEPQPQPAPVRKQDVRVDPDVEATKTAARARQENGTSRLLCPRCGADVWDNREDKKSGRVTERFPNWKCKANCGFVSWETRCVEKATAAA